MNSSYLAKTYQQPVDNILMDFATLSSEMDDIIDLSIGDPDLITSTSITKAAFTDVLAGHTRYTASDGSVEFIDSVLNYYKRFYKLSFKKEQVRATVGAIQGMYLTLQVLLDPKDEVIIHEPFFSPYKTQVIEAGGIPIIIPTFEEDNFEINIDILKKAITQQTKAIIINSPNNPTGAVFSTENFKQIAEIAIKNNLFILSDEVYEAFSFHKTFTPMATYAPENTITFGSFSKSFAMTGWRIGYMIAPDYINSACKLLNEDVTFSAPTPSQRAGIYALNHAEKLIPNVTSVFKKRLDYIEKRVSNIPFLSLLPIKGSIYTFINISQSKLNSVDFALKLLKEKQVLVIPGKAFGKSGDNYIRLAATQEIAILEKAFDRIESLQFSD